MSIARVTQRMMVNHSMSALQLGLSRLADTQEQLSTGRSINRPSDDPTGTNQAMRLRAQMAADAQYSRNAQDGLAFLGTIDSTMTTVLDNVGRARDLIVQGSNTGSMGPQSRQAIAAELTQIREALVNLANTEYMGRPVFGGTAEGPAYAVNDDSTDPNFGKLEYLGDTNPVDRTVGKGVSVQVNLPGPEAFGDMSDPTKNIFGVLDQAITDLTSDPPGDIGANLDTLDAVADSMKAAHSTVGARTNRIEASESRLADVKLTNQAQLSSVENIDIAETIMDLQMQQVAYQASLGATAQVLQPSLLDFLR